MPRVRDYEAWHQSYDDEKSGLSWRLRSVQGYVDRYLDQHAGPRKLLSACAGEGRDVIEVLSGRSDAARIRADLLELHPRIAERARDAAAAVGLSGQVTVHMVDAGESDAYRLMVPADLVLLVGIFGNISDSDLQRTVAVSPQLCRPGATLVWSRGRGREIGDRNDAVRRWFSDAGFAELEYITKDDDDGRPALGVVRYDGPTHPLVLGQRWFTFTR